VTRRTHRREDESTDSGHAVISAPPAPAPPFTPAWAAAVGNQRVARMAAEYAEQAIDEPAAEESDDLLAELVEALADEETADDEVGEATESVATVRRLRVARQPKLARRARKIPLSADDIEDLERVGERAIKELAKLERERALTSVEAEQIRQSIERLMRSSMKGKGDRRVLTKQLDRLRAFPDWVRRRAAAGRSTKGKKLVSNLKLEPPVIRVHQNEAARISFIVKGAPKSITARIFADPQSQGTAFRLFRMEATSGYHQLIWDGTFEHLPKRPPESGVYRVEINVVGADGKSEWLFEQIRVDNPRKETVLPRVDSAPEISTLYFDGKTFILTDTDGNSIEVPASSGLKRSNPRNKDGIDYTDPKHEWVKGKGPIPNGSDYVIKPGQFQVPDADKRGARYASGAETAIWGPMRAEIIPKDPKGNRTEFFLHMDVTNDGTAGCIGIPPAHVGKFNKIMSLIATNKSDVKLLVRY
jgi:hypothetical protein